MYEPDTARGSENTCARPLASPHERAKTAGTEALIEATMTAFDIASQKLFCDIQDSAKREIIKILGNK